LSQAAHLQEFKVHLPVAYEYGNSFPYLSRDCWWFWLWLFQNTLANGAKTYGGPTASICPTPIPVRKNFRWDNANRTESEVFGIKLCASQTTIK